MKEWAEKRRRELEAAGEKELADVFRLVVRICELEEQVKGAREAGALVMMAQLIEFVNCHEKPQLLQCPIPRRNPDCGFVLPQPVRH